jgi:ketosteroid isomerase-like protein
VRTVATFALAAVVAADIGCSSGSSNSTTASSTPATADEGAALMQVSRDWAKAAEARDTERVLAYWADDAIVMPADQPALVGKEAIRGMVQGGFADSAFSITWEPERAVISQSGDMGYLVEHNRMTFRDPSGRRRTTFGKGVTIWKKDANGNWKNVVDIFNTNPTARVIPEG